MPESSCESSARNVSPRGSFTWTTSSEPGRRAEAGIFSICLFPGGCQRSDAVAPCASSSIRTSIGTGRPARRRMGGELWGTFHWETTATCLPSIRSEPRSSQPSWNV